MTISELLTQLTRIFFVLIACFTLIDYLRRRDRVHRDVALVFICMVVGILINVLMDLTGITSQWLPRVGSLAIIAQPILLLRVVRYFRPVNKIIRWVALVGMVTSWVILLAVINAEGLLPSLVTLVIVIYFAIIDGYAIYAFILGAFSSVGVVRKRLQFAAIGSALLVAALLVVGVRTVLPNLSPFTIPPTQVFAMLSALAYYLSFAPPRWLRQAWQLTELRDFLQQVQAPGDNSRSELLMRLTKAVARAMSSDSIAVLLAGEDDMTLVIETECSSPSLMGFPIEGAARRSLIERKPQIIYRSASQDADAVFAESLKVDTIVIVPIATREHTFGLLVVCLEHGSLFIEDDVQLLTVFVQQTAILMENAAVLSALQRYTEDLEKQVKARTTALARSNEELRQFAYVASHDLREPLRTVNSYLQLIEMRYADKLDGDGREFIDFAVDGAARMKALIDDLLVYSRIEQQEYKPAQVDSQRVLDEACKLLQASIKEAEATITHDNMPKIHADERLMLQLFQNLISNAVKYRSDRKPVIQITAYEKAGEWLFSVCDNGIGIEAQYADRIFVIFERLHNQSQYSGTGIGLAICKKVVEIQRGRIWMESEFGIGTTFYFTVPK
jgi:signal transduction histidine kinase